MGLFGRPSEREEQRAAEYGQWLRQRHPLAIASFVLGVFSLIEFGALILPGVAGIVLGGIALRQLRRVNEMDPAAPVPAVAPAPHLREQDSRPVLTYADPATEPPIDAGRYGVDQQTVRPTHGRALATWGILLSALSLMLAGAIYFFRIVP